MFNARGVVVWRGGKEFWWPGLAKAGASSANAVSYIAVIIGLLLMKVHSPARGLNGISAGAHHGGIRFVNRTAADPGVVMCWVW